MDGSNNEKLTEGQRQKEFLEKLGKRASTKYLEDSVFKSKEGEGADEATKKPKVKSSTEQQEDVKQGVGFIFDLAKGMDVEDRGTFYDIIAEFVGLEMTETVKEQLIKKFHESGLLSKYPLKNLKDKDEAEDNEMDVFAKLTKTLEVLKENSDVKSLFTAGNYPIAASALEILRDEGGNFVRLDQSGEIADTLEATAYKYKYRKALLKNIEQTKKFNAKNKGKEKWKGSIIESLQMFLTLITNAILPGACLLTQVAEDNGFGITKERDQKIKGFVETLAKGTEFLGKKVEGVEEGERGIKQLQETKNRKNELEAECDGLEMEGETTKALVNVFPKLANSRGDGVGKMVRRIGQTLER
jgi:hypothetical protein